MNARAQAARPDRHPLRQPGRARRARSLLERPRRDEAGARRDEQALRPRDGPARRGRGGGQAPAHVERPALDLPEPDRRQDRPHERRRLVGGRRRPPRRRHDLRHAARRLEPRRAERRPRGLLAWGLARYRTVWAIDGSRTYGTVRTAYGKPRVRARRRQAGASRDPRRAAAGRARRRARRGGIAGARKGSASARCRCSTAAPSSPARRSWLRTTSIAQAASDA